MTEIKYFCDKCKNEIPDKDQMWEVSLNIRYLRPPGPSSPTRKMNKEWCRSCCEEYSLLPAKDLPEEKRITPPPTLEDLVREICHEELEYANSY